VNAKEFLLQFFTWWNGQTLGTRFYTWRRGEFVGEDEYANRYYRERGGERRWVIYNGEVDASRIPPGWHGWLHRRTDTPPSQERYALRPWEKPHQPNLTGTPAAHHPPGSLRAPGARSAASAHYQAWKPE
jgi:NADH:ubiquinone oxidoreductase subunit